jgi:hypothetical protein
MSDQLQSVQNKIKTNNYQKLENKRLTVDKYFIGFDPSKTGAVAVLVETGNLVTAFNLPEIQDGKNNHRFHASC